jgi:transposase
MSVSWIVSLALPVAWVAGWLSAGFIRGFRSSLAILSACRGLGAGDVRHDPGDIRRRLEGDDDVPGKQPRDARPAPDRKEQALRRSRTLNPRPGGVSDERFAAAGFFDARDMVQVKYEMVRTTREDGASVTAAAAAFGLSRQSFYQAAAALQGGGLAALVPGRPGPKGGHKLTAEVIAWIAGQKAASPGLRAAQLAALVEEQFGFRVHPRSVQRVLARVDGSKSTG